MKKKQKKIQIILILIGLILIFATYFYYPYMERMKLVKNQPAEQKLEEINEDKNNERTFFKNVEYKGYYDLDKPFIIKSDEAHLLNEEPDIVYMTNMHVVLYLSDGRIVNITSDEGKYNKLTYDCYFKKNVTANDGETKITAENLDLLATEDSVKIYNKVNLSDPKGSLLADNVAYNFETKYFKVSMFDDKTVKMKVIK